MPHAELFRAAMGKQGQGLVGLLGLSGLLAPLALRYASLPLLACRKFGRAWNLEDNFQYLQSLAIKASLKAVMLAFSILFCMMAHDPHEIFLCVSMYL